MKELWIITPMVVMIVGFIIVGIEIFCHSSVKHYTSA
jgi:hypothetical protein